MPYIPSGWKDVFKFDIWYECSREYRQNIFFVINNQEVRDTFDNKIPALKFFTKLKNKCLSVHITDVGNATAHHGVIKCGNL